MNDHDSLTDRSLLPRAPADQDQDLKSIDMNRHTDNSTESLSSSAQVAPATNCERCALLDELLIKAEDDLAELGRQIAGLELQLRRAGSAELALRNELEQHREQDPMSQQIRTVLDYWQRKLNHPRAKVPLTGKRAKVVRRALRAGFDEQQLRQAIDGLARLPYVGAHGRKATGTNQERYDDVEHALRDEPTIERFIRYATEPPSVRQPPRGDWPRPVDRLLGLLENVKQSAVGQWTARCPAHDDKHASLSVAQGRVGVVVRCHAGCQPEAIADATGVPLQEWFEPDHAPATAPLPAAAPREPDPLPTEIGLHTWHLALLANEPLLERIHELKGWEPDTLKRLGVAFDGQRIVFAIRDEHGELVSLARYAPTLKPKMLGLHGRARGLFPAPEWVYPDATIWLVEGEPDAVSGHQIGINAVGVPGVNGWRQEWAARFDDRNVVVCFDCDKPGRDAAQRVASTLNGRAKDVRIVDLDSSRDDGYDMSDAMRDGVTAAVLTAMAADAIPSRTLRLIA